MPKRTPGSIKEIRDHINSKRGQFKGNISERDIKGIVDENIKKHKPPTYRMTSQEQEVYSRYFKRSQKEWKNRRVLRRIARDLREDPRAIQGLKPLKTKDIKFINKYNTHLFEIRNANIAVKEGRGTAEQINIVNRIQRGNEKRGDRERTSKKHHTTIQLNATIETLVNYFNFNSSPSIDLRKLNPNMVVQAIYASLLFKTLIEQIYILHNKKIDYQETLSLLRSINFNRLQEDVNRSYEEYDLRLFPTQKANLAQNEINLAQRTRNITSKQNHLNNAITHFKIAIGDTKDKKSKAYIAFYLAVTYLETDNYPEALLRFCSSVSFYLDNNDTLLAIKAAEKFAEALTQYQTTIKEKVAELNNNNTSAQQRIRRTNEAQRQYNTLVSGKHSKLMFAHFFCTILDNKQRKTFTKKVTQSCEDISALVDNLKPPQSR